MTPAVQWLIAICVAVLFLQFTKVLPADSIGFLGFQAVDFRTQWWTVATYMFVHGDLIHLALNMYMLWVFGRRLEHVWGSGAFTRYYLWCGIGGLLAHVLLVGGGTLIGASAAVYGIMLGYAMTWPEDEVFLFGVIPMKVKWMVAAFVALNLVSGIMATGSVGGVAYFAHLGGLAFGFIYMRMPSPSALERIRPRVSQVPDETDEPPRAVPRSLPRTRERMSEIDEIVAKSNAVASRKNTTFQPRKSDENGSSADALNLVLDKISQRGLESLTPAERKLLEDMSRELRTRE